jgi:hypothetical protein
MRQGLSESGLRRYYYRILAERELHRRGCARFQRGRHVHAAVSRSSLTRRMP